MQPDLKFNHQYEENLAHFFDLLKWEWIYLSNNDNFAPNFILFFDDPDAHPKIYRHVNVYIKLNEERTNKYKIIDKIIESGYDGDYLLIGKSIDEIFYVIDENSERNGYAPEGYVSMGIISHTRYYFLDMNEAILINCVKCKQITISVTGEENYGDCHVCEFLDSFNHLNFGPCIGPSDPVDTYKIFQQWCSIMPNINTKYREFVIDLGDDHEMVIKTLINLKN